ncbi:MAG: hypothetical protein HY074_14015 [Deltaproteobacteria bacterium]|nr:hypothetical protein [Deltaproteobacteria bacterium]
MTRRIMGIISAFLLLTSSAFAREGTLTNYHGVWVMNLYGSRTEMAAQHGRLIRNRINETALPFFSNKIHNAIKQTYIIKDFPALAAPTLAAIDFWVTHPLRRALPHEDHEVLKAFATAAHYPVNLAYNAGVVPDVGQWLTTTIFHKNNVLDGAFGGAGAFGCSSFVLPSASGLVHARNLDYESYGIFDKYPAIIYFHPDKPGAQSYTSVTSLGIHTAGITATNASGLTVEIHQTFVSAVSRTGTPIIATTERVIRDAHNFDEALHILKTAKYAGSWAVVVSSARENRAAVVEVSADGAQVREMPESNGKYLVMTNHVFTPLMKKREYAVNYSGYLESRERYALLDHEAREMSRTGRTDVQSAIDLISNGPVAKLNNIQSVVFLPRQNAIYVAVPSIADTEPANGNFVALPADGDFETFDALPDLPRSQPPAHSRMLAHALRRQASAAATEEGKFVQAAGLLLQAAELEPANPEYTLLAALSYLHASPGLKDDTARLAMSARADELLLRAQNANPSKYHESVIRLFRGRYLDSLGTAEARTEALHQYSLVDTTYSKPLRDAVAADIKAPYGAREFRKITIDYLHGDLYRF